MVEIRLSTGRGRTANTGYLMAKLPNPPGIDELSKIPPQIKTISVGTEVSRVYFANSTHPTHWNQFRHFGPTASRFDHHLLDTSGTSFVQDRGIMYVAAGPEAASTCLAEVFQSKRTIDRNAGLPIYVGFVLEADVNLLDLTTSFVTAMGASTAIHSGPRPRARRWSQQLYQAYPEIDGILYCSSMYGNAPAIALYERAKRAIPDYHLFHRELRDVAMNKVVIQIATKINYAVV